MTDRVKDVVEKARDFDTEEKLDVIRLILENDDLYEELEDALYIIERGKEPRKNYDDFIEELREEGSPV